MKTLVLATYNAGKAREMAHLFKEGDKQLFDVVSQGNFNVPEADETGLTFVENALIKARNAAQHTGLPALADDSGLEVDALRGAPGIYSARFAGKSAGDVENNQLLLERLRGVPPEQRTARYQCVIVFLRHALDPTPMIFSGTWEGIILEQPQGNQGFGYDPLFWLATHQCTAAELSLEVKNQLSHRGQALRKLHDALVQVV